MIEDEIKIFISKQKSLHLACIKLTDKEQLSSQQQALISYTPFIYDPETNLFYIFISKLAEHGKYLPTNQLISIMLIEDELSCHNLFARKRLTYSCAVSPIYRKDDQWVKFIGKFKQQFGKIIDLLSQFNDFDMYCLRPQNGNYVQGFGKAYEINNGQITHLEAKTINSKSRD
jgi:heme iron utilization protein